MAGAEERVGELLRFAGAIRVLHRQSATTSIEDFRRWLSWAISIAGIGAFQESPLPPFQKLPLARPRRSGICCELVDGLVVRLFDIEQELSLVTTVSPGIKPSRICTRSLSPETPMRTCEGK